MYTETELRDMLRASADRVPAGSTSTIEGDQVDLDDTNLFVTPRPRRLGRRLVAPLAVAAATVALVAAVASLTQHSGGSHGQSVAARPPAPAHAAHPSAPAAIRSHQATTAIIDAVTVDTTNSTENYVAPIGDDDHGQQVVVSQLPGGRAINLVIAPARDFSGAKVSHAHPVSIAGTTGYYDVLRLFPLSDGGDGKSAATGIIVFRTPAHQWAFVWLQAGTKNNTEQGTPVDDPSAIRKGFAKLHATFVNGKYRSPFKLGYLPAGARFISADQTTASAPGVTFADLTATDGDKQMDVSLLKSTEPSQDGKDCTFKTIGCVAKWHRDLPGGWQLQAQGIGYSVTQTKAVVDHTRLASDLNDRSTYFTLPDAIG